MKLYYNQNRKRHSIRHSRQDLHPRLFPSRKRRDNTCDQILFVPTVYPRIVRVGAVCSRVGREEEGEARIRANNVLFRDNE